MKQHITEMDLLDLTEEQKQSLRDLWVPRENDLAVAYICSDAEADEYEAIVFTVGRVDCSKYESQGIFNTRNRHISMVLRSLRLIDDSFYEELEKEDEALEELELDYQTPEDYFNYDYCLPLLRIGQLIEILGRTYYSTEDFAITFNREVGRYRIGETMYTGGSQYFDFEAEELCDALWEALKSVL